MKSKKFEYKKVIKDLVSMGNRQLEKETQAFLYIKDILDKNNISYTLQKYNTFVPKFLKYELLADGKKIECLPSGFVSGKIEGKHAIISTISGIEFKEDVPNINFNPECKSISRGDHYNAPALSVKYTDIAKICSAKNVVGELIVEKTKHESVNILVGNSKNPKNILFSHYDSIQSGAVDNASGVALSLDLIINNPLVLKDSLFVICGNEEIAYDKEYYWGYGYRVFEKKFSNLLKSAKRILVLDSFGYTEPVLNKDIEIVILGFPIYSLKKYIKKIAMISGEINELMKFYHSDSDTPNLIKENFYQNTKKLTLKEIGY
jgi:hypothetical protein